MGSAAPRAVLPAIALALTILQPLPAASQTSDEILYIMPSWKFPTSDVVVAQQVDRLRTVIGEGQFVRVGFTTYIHISMTDWSVDVSDRAAVRNALASTIADIEEAVGRAETHQIPIALSFLTAIRERTDPVQVASALEDRRNMQWYNDNELASGWWTHSRYARRARVVQEAYMRELGAVVADLMRRYPDTLVAASGDGEVELSYDRATPFQAGATVETSFFADYSPFAVLEFRDWVRGEGLYAAGQPLSGEAYLDAARYTGDVSPGADSNGDGHTLNGDFGVSFSTWDLRFGDWSLDDSVDTDPNAIPAAAYTAPGWTMADAGTDHFDAPRSRQPGNAWWHVWMQFRQMMIWRHNLDVARWMTSSPDDTGATIPPARWYSDQIPADYLFGYSPANPSFRLETSASPWWTADVSPHGSVGITSFNINVGGYFARTLVNVAPHVSSGGRRWAILEWNPSVPASASVDIYRDEMSVIERFRPSLVVPFLWGNDETWGIEGTPFETALSELVDRLKDGLSSLTLSTSSLHFAGIVTGGALSAVTPAQEITVTPTAGTAWTVTADQPWLEVSGASGTGPGTFGVSVVGDPGLPSAGTVTATVTVSGIGIAEVPVDVDVSLNLLGQEATLPPFGLVDTPSQDEAGVAGTIAVTGWVLDDVGVTGVRLYRNCLPFEPFNCTLVNGQSLVFVGDATLVRGARPDIEALYPTYPKANVAAWGYLMLTSLLPHVPATQLFGGQGPMTFYVFAADVEGNLTQLGRTQLDTTPTRITMDNDNIDRPFGAIDTPGQGETIAGAFANFGWSLTPDGNDLADGTDILVPTDGSTSVVYIDGAAVGMVSYDQCRGTVGNPVPGGLFCDDDVSNIFGNLAPLAPFTGRTSNPTRHRNLDGGRGPIGAYLLDTTTLSNGLHTILWGVTDTAGRGEGIGSRFITVLNGSTLLAESLAIAPTIAMASATELAAWPSSEETVWGRQGFDLSSPWEILAPDGSGTRAVRASTRGRLEVWLGDDPLMAGYLVANGTLRALPPGSRLDKAARVFTWAPGPGYLGTYDLSFLRLDGTKVSLEVTVVPTEATGHVEAAIDRPGTGTAVGGPFAVEGWALDTGAWQGTGIGAVHVWAQRLDVPGAAPVFLGAAQLGGRRSDVATEMGAQFAAAGWSLTVAGLPAGTYDITAYIWSARTQQFEDARTVMTTVR